MHQVQRILHDADRDGSGQHTDRVARADALKQTELLALYASLTPREQELLPLLVRGLLNKQAAAELGITEYTVQIHRGNIMRLRKF